MDEMGPDCPTPLASVAVSSWTGLSSLPMADLGIPASLRDSLGFWDAVWQAPRSSVLAALSVSIAREPNAPTLGLVRTGLHRAARWRRWGGVRRVGASWRCCRPLSCPVNCIGGQPVLVGVWGGLATWPGSHRGVHWRRCGVMDWLWSLPLVGDDDRPHPRLALGPAPAGCRLPGLFVPRCPPHSRPRWHKESPTLLPMDWLGLACTAPLAGGAVMSWTGWDAPRGR